jgi:acyl-CoA thioesterase-1
VVASRGCPTCCGGTSLRSSSWSSAATTACAALPGPAGARAAGRAAIIDKSRAAGAKVLLVSMEIPPNYGQRYVDAFRAAFPAVAQSRKVPLVPFILRDVALNRQLMQADGIHPTAAAQPALLAVLWPEIQRALARP